MPIVRCGATRTTILTGGYAIKIMRVNLAPFVRAAFQRLIPGKVLEVESSTKRSRPIQVQRVLKHFWHALTDGLVANRQEFFFTRANPHLPLVRVHALVLWGAILIQERGEPARTDEIRRHWHFAPGQGFPRDLVCARHIYRVTRNKKTTFALIDCGEKSTRRALVHYFGGHLTR